MTLIPETRFTYGVKVKFTRRPHCWFAYFTLTEGAKAVGYAIVDTQLGGLSFEAFRVRAP